MPAPAPLPHRTAVALLSLACALLPSTAGARKNGVDHSRDRGGLRQYVDRDGVVHLTGRGSAPSLEEPASSPDAAAATDDTPGVTLRSWTDKSGVVHLTAAPTRKAVEKARREKVTPTATGKATKVRDVNTYDAAISQAATRYSIPHALVRAVIVAESNFNPDAVSRAGAVGLMQIMPDTARTLAVSNRSDPFQSIEGGTRYLRILANEFNGDLVRTIAAYNAGPGAVRKYDGVPPFKETRGYVKRVLSLYQIYANRGG